MNKKIVLATCVSALLAFGAPIFADEHNHASEGTPAATQNKTGRKKRQLMCKECGKPEKQCECKGEEHRKDESHEHEKKK